MATAGKRSAGCALKRGIGKPFSSRWQDWGERLRSLSIFPALLVLLAVAAYAIGDAVSAPAPVPKGPSFIDTVFGSHAVVAAIRLAIIFAAAFVALSVVALAAKGQWLVRVGPVQVSERVSDLGTENRRLKERLANANEAIGDLEAELTELNCLLYRELKSPGEAE